MVLEWYCNYGTLFKLGPFIFSTYGVAVGLGGFMHYHVVMTFLSTFVASGLLAPAIGAQASVLAWVGTAITVLGWRMCSMFIEDIHEIRAGNIIGAFLRPGYLEAGGNSALMIYAFLSGLGWGTDLSLNGLKNYMLLSDVRMQITRRLRCAAAVATAAISGNHCLHRDGSCSPCPKLQLKPRASQRMNRFARLAIMCACRPSLQVTTCT